MKLLIVIAVILQLSLSNGSTSNVFQPAYDKLYPIFDFITTKMYELLGLEANVLVSVINRMLPEYKKAHKGGPYKDYEDAIDKLLRTMKQFVKDPSNCQHQHAIENAFSRLTQIDSEYDHTELFKDFILRKHIKIKQEQEHDTFIFEITKQLPHFIRNFIESLNEEEKQTYAELYKYGEEIINATDRKHRFRAILNFISNCELILVEANDENCKLDLDNLIEFMRLVRKQL